MNEAFGLLEDDDPRERNPNLSRSLHELDIYLLMPKRYEKALPPTEKAVVLGKKLTCANPRWYNGDFAFSLYRLSCVFSMASGGTRKHCPSEEIIKLRKELARGEPEKHNTHLVNSLNSLGLSFSCLGRSTYGRNSQGHETTCV